MHYSGDQLFFQWLLRIYVWLLAKAYGLEKLNQGEIKMNYIVKDDNPDVGFAVTVGDVTDSEGQVIPDAQLSFEIASSDESVLAVTVNEDGKSGSVHFGAPGVAAISVQVKDAAARCSDRAAITSPSRPAIPLRSAASRPALKV
jgi:hypothetical protein